MTKKKKKQQKTSKKSTTKAKSAKKKPLKKSKAAKKKTSKKTARTTSKKHASKSAASSKRTAKKSKAAKKKTSKKPAKISTKKPTKKKAKTSGAKKQAGKATSTKPSRPAKKIAATPAATVKSTAKKKTIKSTATQPAPNHSSEPAPASQIESAPMPQVGDQAPDFELPVTGGGTVRLSQYQGDKNVVLYFYPKDDTPGCTKQACKYQEDLSQYGNVDAVIIGVSTDSLKSHDKFRNKYGLQFMLASDEEAEVATAYGTYGQKSMYGRTYMGITRTTFVIDKDGIVRAVWPKVSVDGHSAEVIEELNRANNYSEQ